MHQFPVRRNQPVAEPEALARALRPAVDTKVGADASFEPRAVAALALTRLLDLAARCRTVPGGQQNLAVCDFRLEFP